MMMVTKNIIKNKWPGIILTALFLFIFLFLPRISLAAEGDLIWTQYSDYSSYSEGPTDIAIDGTGVYVVGYSGIFPDAWRVEKRTLADGSLIWSRMYSPTSAIAAATGVAADGTGVYVVGRDGSSLRVEKRSLTDGSLIWDWMSPDPGAGKIDISPTDVTVDSTGVYVVGYAEVSYTEWTDQWRVEKRSLTDGSLIWSQASNPTAWDDQPYEVVADNTGIYVVGAEFKDWRVEKRSLTDGSLIWVQTYDSNVNISFSSDTATGVAVDGTGVYVVGCEQTQNFAQQWRVEKRSLASGSLIWARAKNLSLEDDVPTGVTIDSTGIYVVGYDGDSAHQMAQWLMEKRSLTNGSLIWFRASNPMNLRDVLYGVTVDGTGVYMIGTIFSDIDNSEKWIIEKREIIPPPLTVSKAGAGSGTVTSNPVGIDCGADCAESYLSGTSVTLTASPIDGSAFAGWSGACSGTGSCILTMDAAKSATATFNNINTDNQPPVSVATISKDGATYTNSITVTRGVAVPIYLSAFGSSDPNGWTDATYGVSSGGKCEWNSDLNQGAPTFEQTINNPASPSACNISLGNLTFNDVPGTYTYQVLRITDKVGGVSGVGTVSVTVQARVPYALTVSKAGAGSGTVTSNPVGINCGADCAESYISGTSVTLTASPFSRSAFAGWSGACSGTGSCVLTMDAAKSVTATFTLACALPWGGTISHGSSVTAYSTDQVACGVSCSSVSETRTCNNGVLSGSYTNLSCSPAVCPDFSLSSSNAIFASLVGGASSISTETTITLTPSGTFASNVGLSIDSVNPALSGATKFNFTDSSLSSSEYSTGTKFSVNVPAGTPSGLYTIIIKGEGGELIRTTDPFHNIQLNVEAVEPNWIEI